MINNLSFGWRHIGEALSTVSIVNGSPKPCANLPGQNKGGCGRNVTLFFFFPKEQNVNKTRTNIRRTKREQKVNEQNQNKPRTKGEQTVNKQGTVQGLEQTKNYVAYMSQCCNDVTVFVFLHKREKKVLTKHKNYETAK